MGVQTVQAPQSESTLTIMAMIKMFGPIVIFSIILPLVDIVTDLRLISRLYISVCYAPPYPSTDNSWRKLLDDCRASDDLSTFCHQNPTVCDPKYKNFAILLFGEYKI